MKVPPFSLSQQLVELSSELESAVLRVLHSGQYIGGTEIELFEKAFAALVGVPFVVGCNSGTDALVLALRALDIGIGDEVITTSFSFFATAEAISAVGAKPVFVDVEEKTFLIDLDLIEKAITPSTKAILPVHLFGRPVEMNALMKLARKYKLKVIEDCAQAAGASFTKGHVGSVGDVGCFSFFPTKNLGAAGDGGAVTTKSPVLAKRMRELAVHGMPKRYLHTELGYNSRLDALQAAVLNVKLPRLASWIDQREGIALRYLKDLSDLKNIILPKVLSPLEGRHGWNQFVIRITNPIKEYSLEDKDYLLPRDSIKKELSALGVETIIYYPIPIHLQPAYKSIGLNRGSLPVTERLCMQVISLPIFPEMTPQQQDKVIHGIREVAILKDV